MALWMRTGLSAVSQNAARATGLLGLGQQDHLWVANVINAIASGNLGRIGVTHTALGAQLLVVADLSGGTCVRAWPGE